MKTVVTILILLVAGVATAQPIVLTQMPADGTYVLTVTGGAVTLQKATVLQIGPAPIDPDDPTPPPTTGIQAVTEAALKTVPAYADRDTHIRGLAFSLNFLAPQLKNSNQPLSATRATMKQLTTLAGADAPKWAQFWTALESQIDLMIGRGEVVNNAQLGEVYMVIQQVVEADIPPSDDVEEDSSFGGIRNYGLDKFNPEFWAMLMQVLLPLLLKLLMGI